MGKILDARGDEAFDVLAELVEPATDIVSDGDVVKNLATGGKKIVAVKKILSDHKDAVVRMLAIDDGITPEEERKIMSAVTIPFRVFVMIATPEIQQLFFGLAGMNQAATGSSAASTNESE